MKTKAFHFTESKLLHTYISWESAKSRAWCAWCSRALPVYELAYSRAWRACVLTCLACLRAYVLGVPACLTCFCTRVFKLRACYDACLTCSALAYSRFCLIIVFVCTNQGFTIKGKLLIHVNLS